MKKILSIFIIFIGILIFLLIIGKKQITTEIVINAPAESVWTVLTDFKSYPQWNPLLKKLAGTVKTGETITVTFSHEGKSMEFTPRVIQFKKNSIFQWEGRLLIPGVFTGRHTFRLEQIDTNTTRLVQEEDFNGILVPFFNFDSTIAGFKAMNRIIKERAEKIN